MRATRAPAHDHVLKQALAAREGKHAQLLRLINGQVHAAGVQQEGGRSSGAAWRLASGGCWLGGRAGTACCRQHKRVAAVISAAVTSAAATAAAAPPSQPSPARRLASPPAVLPLPPGSAGGPSDLSQKSACSGNMPLLVMRSRAVWSGCAPSTWPAWSRPASSGPNSKVPVGRMNCWRMDGVGGRALAVL